MHPVAVMQFHTKTFRCGFPGTSTVSRHMPARVALLTLSTKARMKDTCTLHFRREKAVHAEIFWGVGVFLT